MCHPVSKGGHDTPTYLVFVQDKVQVKVQLERRDHLHLLGGKGVIRLDNHARDRQGAGTTYTGQCGKNGSCHVRARDRRHGVEPLLELVVHRAEVDCDENGKGCVVFEHIKNTVV